MQVRIEKANASTEQMMAENLICTPVPQVDHFSNNESSREGLRNFLENHNPISAEQTN